MKPRNAWKMLVVFLLLVPAQSRALGFSFQSVNLMAGGTLPRAEYGGLYYNSQQIQPKVLPALGAAAEFLVHEQWFMQLVFQPGLAYAGYKFRIHDSAASLQYAYPAAYDFSYAGVQALVKIKFNFGSLRPYVFGGPQFDYLVAATLTVTPNNYFLGHTAALVPGELDLKDKKIIRKTRWMIDAGAGLEWELATPVALLVDLRYQRSFDKINDSSSDIRMDALQAMTGLRIGI